MTALMIEAAFRALVFAIAVGAGLRLLRVSNVPVRKAVWSVVLIASLAMPFLMRWQAVAGWANRFGWAVPVRMHRPVAAPAPVKAAPVASAPLILATIDESGDSAAAGTIVASSPTAVSVIEDQPAVVVSTPAAGFASRPKFQWPPAGRLIAMIYLGVAGALLLRLLWGLGLALRLWMTADLVSPLVAPEPSVRSSARIASPVTIGSGIVLPANYAEWDRRKLRMVLAHERSHVRQMDFYLQLLAGVYTAMFWFSPLGWWLRRTLSTLGEAIGDRAGIDAAASRSRYAEILLEFAAMPRQTLPGVAMARPGNLSRRIERLLNEHWFRSAFAEGRRRALVSLLLIPAALFAATALIRMTDASAQTAPTAPAPASAPAAPAAPPASAAATEIPPDQNVPPAAPVAPNAVPALPAPPASGAPLAAPPAPPAPGSVDVEGSDTTSVSDDDQKGYVWHFSDNGESYAMIDGPGTSLTFSGEWSEERKAGIDAARKVAKGPFLWFTHEGKSYIVTDPAIVAKIRAMYKPMEDLGRQQSELGKKQEALDKQMEALDSAEEEAGQVKVPDLSKEMAALNEAVAKAKEAEDKWNTDALAKAEASLKAAHDQMLTPEKMAELQAKLAEAQAQFSSDRVSEMQDRLGELQARLGELQGEAGARQGDFGAKMGALGEQQGRLGEQEGHLGMEQGRLAEQADRQVRSIIDECLRNGKAAQVPNVNP
jgi:hypothetical protein